MVSERLGTCQHYIFSGHWRPHFKSRLCWGWKPLPAPAIDQEGEGA